jgi:hypothetical protein
MKRKLFSLMILSLIITTAFSQSTVTVLINGVKKGSYTIKVDQTDAAIILKKTDCKKLSKLEVQISGEYLGNAIYKRTLDIFDSTDHPVVNITETAPGQFSVTNTIIKSMLLKGNNIKLYLLMEPADSRMMAPSKHIYLGNLSAK